MRKVPSVQKISNSRTNLTQHLSLNSPKATLSQKQLFKNHKSGVQKPNEPKHSNSKSKLNYYAPNSTLGPRRVSSGNLTKMPLNESSPDQEEIGELKSKLKQLQKKISSMKVIKKKKKSEKSQRNHSKVKETHTSAIENKSSISNCKKKEASASKLYKKAHSDKYLIRPPLPKKYNSQDKQISSKSEEKDSQLHKFITQVARHQPKQQIHTGRKHADRIICYYVQNVVQSISKNCMLPFKQHVGQSLMTIKYLQQNGGKKPSLKQLQKHFAYLPPSKHKYSLVLDLDQTLIHCNDNLGLPHDVTLRIKFPTGQKVEAGVNVRPYALQLLKELSALCQIIVFTASHECYANVVIDHLDPKGEFVSHRLFRSHCWQTAQNVYIKDLRVLRGRQLSNVLLVDNAAYSYFYQLENGIPIIPFYDDRHDEELLHLSRYVRGLIVRGEQGGSVKQVNQRYFQLQNYHQYQNSDSLMHQLYKQTLAGYRDIMK